MFREWTLHYTQRSTKGQLLLLLLVLMVGMVYQVMVMSLPIPPCGVVDH